MQRAKHYKKLEDNLIQCHLCPHRCRIAPEQRGICKQRFNHEGVLYAQNYGRVSSMGMDPIEKKPLYHFYPGSNILSIGTIGCNFRCSFCQNWEIAQKEADTISITPEQVVEYATAKESIGIAFTYNEPSIWYEFVMDTCLSSIDQGLKNVLVTNGFIEEEPLEELLPYIHALNIDVKAFSEQFYQKICGGNLETVKRTVERAAASCHVEVTTLIISGYNDTPDEIGKMAQWLSSLPTTVPLHLSRYFPNYLMDQQATPIERITQLQDAAKQYLDYVYIGNIPSADANTYCPRCGNKLVDRSGYRGYITGLRQGLCSECKKDIPILY